jgi:predicted acetyltransferase
MQTIEMYVNGCERDLCQAREHGYAQGLGTVDLVSPRNDLRVEFLTMAKEYQCFGDQRYAEAIENFPAYVHSLEDFAKGRNLPDGFVRSDTFWLVRNGTKVLGCSRFRHSLTPWLEHEGGHIGYDIRPLERHKGYGTLILALTLEKARQAGLDRVLLVCHKNNVASVAVIEKNGGKFENEVTSSRDGKVLARYWIQL